MTQSLLYDLILILAAGLLAGLVCRLLQTSVLVGYLAVGALLGKGCLGWVLDHDHQLEHFAEAGVFLLLFSIGLEFSLDDLRKLGSKLLIGGSTQMTLVMLPVAGSLIGLGVSIQASILLASAVAFSSTVLVFKSLSECGQSESRHGRRAIGILLFQDAALVPLLLAVPLLSGTGESPGLLDYLELAGISLLFLVFVVMLRWFLAEHLIPALTRYRSPDLVILFTVVVLAVVTLAAYSAGLPPAVGAFAAGLIFNGNRWTRQIDALVLPFRETFAAIFFVGLGLVFDPVAIRDAPLLVVGLFAGMLAIKTIAAMLAFLLTGMNVRQSLGMGIGLAHIGEFAFVLVLLGLESSVLTEQQYQFLLTIGIASLIATPTLMRYGLRFVASGGITEEQPEGTQMEISGNQAVVVGAGPIGRRMASMLETRGKDVCLVDLSPINLHPFAAVGFRTVAGDATEEDTLRFAQVEEAALLAVSVPDDHAALRIVRAVRQLNRQATIIVRCRFHSFENKLRKAGADRVVSEETVATIALLDELNSAKMFG